MTWLDLPPKPAISTSLKEAKPKATKLGTFTFPVGFFGAAVGRQYLGVGFSNEGNTTSYSFSLNTGSPGLVVASIGVSRAIGSGSISSVSIGGVGASIVQATGRPNNNFSACVAGLAYAVSAGGVQTISISVSSAESCGCELYLITGYTSASPHATATGSAFLSDATSASASLAVPAGGVAIATLTATQFQGGLSATSLPVNFARLTNNMPWYGLSDQNLAAGNYGIVNASGTGCGRAIAAASWQ